MAVKKTATKTTTTKPKTTAKKATTTKTPAVVYENLAEVNQGARLPENIPPEAWGTMFLTSLILTAVALWIMKQWPKHEIKTPATNYENLPF